MERKYKAASGSIQRKKLFKDILGRQHGFGASPREVRRSVGRMFSFEPLSQVTPSEKALLKRITATNVQWEVAKHAETAKDLVSGAAGISTASFDQDGETVDRTKVLEIFSKPTPFDSIRVVPRFSRLIGGNIGPGSRGLEEYRTEHGFDVLKLVREIKKRKRKVRVLDVGAATANMLGELKEVMGKGVETHALSPVDYPRQKVDAYHMLTGEFMPHEFRNKFDLIVSQWALEYAVLPHLALRNISHALAPGGIGLVEWRPNRIQVLGGDVGRASKFFSNYASGKPTSAGHELIREGFTTIGKAKTADEVKRHVEEKLAKHGPSAKHEITWVNEVARLRQDPKLKVSVLHYVPSLVGPIPAILKIHRV